MSAWYTNNKDSKKQVISTFASHKNLKLSTKVSILYILFIILAIHATHDVILSVLKINIRLESMSPARGPSQTRIQLDLSKAEAVRRTSS